VEVFLALKGNDIDLIIAYDHYAWTVNGLTVGDIPNNIKSYNMRARLGHGTMEIRLSHDGAYPFQTNLTWYVGIGFAGMTLYCYEYITGELEYMTLGEVDSDGYINLDLAYADANRYVLLEYGPEGPPEDEPAPVETPYEPGEFTAEPTLPQMLVVNEFTPANAAGVRPFIMRYVGDGYQIGLISLRAYSDFIQGTPVWDAETSTATVTGTDANGNPVVVSMVSGQTQITVNGASYDIGEYAGASNLSGLCTALNENDAIYLPLRAVTNAFGGRLDWNPDTATATIHRR
jgi:hypothetical protein